MEKFKQYLLQPYAEKGVVLATIDLALRALTVAVWGYLMFILCGLLVQSFLLDYDPRAIFWWFSYCFILFFGASWLAYIMLFARSYYYADEN